MSKIKWIGRTLSATRWYLISLVIISLLVWGVISLFQKTPGWAITTVIVCVCVIPPLLALGFLWRVIRRRYPKAAPTPAPSGSSGKKWHEKIDWKLPVIVVGCEIFFLTVCHLWHWLWSVLGLWVLVLQIAIVFAFLFCKDEDKKSKNGGKMNDTGKLMVVTVIITAIVSYFIGVWSLPTPIESVKHGITSKLHLFGDSLPEENVAMRAAVVKYLQDNLQDDIHGQQFLLKVAENASHFNQTLDGKTALRRKVGGREKIGLMGVDECVWAEVGNGTPLAGSPEQNLEAAMVLYKTYGRIPWSMNVRFITRHSKTFSVPATGWSAEVPIGARLDYLRPSEAVQLATDKDVEFRVDPDNSNWDLPQKTSWVKYRALSGKPTVVLATPSSELR